MIKKSILAGILIGIGCIINLTIGNIIGALLFSLGLLTIIQLKLNLFTGKCGYANSIIDYVDLFKILIGNFIGIAFIGFILPVEADIANKLTYSIFELFAKGIGCGMLMYTAVACKKEIITIFCVMVFILSKFEHCIADIYYLINSNSSILESLKIFSIVCIGNVIGGQLIHRLNK